MKTATRFMIVSVALVLCASGIVIANFPNNQDSSNEISFKSADLRAEDDSYQFASSRTLPSLTFRQLEAMIRRDPVAKSQRGRIEFGSVKMDEAKASAEVMFVDNDGRVIPFVYKLLPERNSWKIVNVQRMWFVPRSHLLRGVRA